MKQITVEGLSFSVKTIPQSEMEKIKTLASDRSFHKAIIDKYIITKDEAAYKQMAEYMLPGEIEEFRTALIQAAIASMSSSRATSLHKVAEAFVGRLNQNDEFFALERILSTCGYKYSELRDMSEYDKWELALNEAILKVDTFNFTGLLKLAIGDAEELQPFLEYYINRQSGNQQPQQHEEDDDELSIIQAIEGATNKKAGEWK